MDGIRTSSFGMVGLYLVGSFRVTLMESGYDDRP
jgi:hypothetical protein